MEAFSSETTVDLPPVRRQSDEAAELKTQVIVMSGPEMGQVFALSSRGLRIGRDDATDLVLSDPGVSREHALIYLDARGRYRIRDQGSRNGVVVNGVVIDGDRVVAPGDDIEIGVQTVLRISRDEQLSAYARRMSAASLHDHLTGVYNRRYFDQQLRAELAFALRHRVPLSLILLDIDRFKAVNDRLGHPAGDAALVQCAERVAELVRQEDLFARYGGEEFALVCRGTGLLQARSLAERICSAVRAEPFSLEGKRRSLTISAGVAELDPSIGTPHELVAAADRALLAAKRAGRDRVELGRMGSDELGADEQRSPGGRRRKGITWDLVGPVVRGVRRSLVGDPDPA